MRLIGIDIGTSSVKGVVCDGEGRILARAQHPLTTSMPHPGWVEQDAERDWWGGVRAVLPALLAAAPSPDAVCVTGLGPCVVPVDADGTPLRPAILYGVDTRATAEIAELQPRSEARLTSQAVGPKLLWLTRHEPDVWDRTERLLGANAFLVERLTGAYVLDHHSASQWNPLYDLRAGAWTEERVLDKRLPPLLWPGEQAGTVTAQAAAQTGIPQGTPVAAGTIDAWAEALSAGVQAPGDLMLMYGTTMFLIATVDAPRSDDRLWTTAGIRPATYSLAGGMATSGALTSWFKDLTRSDDYFELLDAAAAVPAGSEGLVVLPYFLGERSPLFDPDARGVIAGLTLRHGRGHIYRALLEATAFAVRHHLEVLAEIGAHSTRLVAVGGGTQGGLWPQIVSDVTGVAQEVPRETIGAAYGAARLAGDMVGAPGSDWAVVHHTVAPDPAVRSTYDQLYATYRELYPATREQVHALAGMQRR